MTLPPGLARLFTSSARYGFGREHRHDRDRFRRVLCGDRSDRPGSHDEVDLAVNELGCGVGQHFDVHFRRLVLDRDGLPVDVTELA